ncbi:DUF2185 domain-containing protein [Pelagicoccus mobilis]|uniref:DUF2185 domain-containing protein n=1 Tax=Pelagicoccus mobilis TaxID=415221 RepID=A0A934VUN0_9BACT|nr:DUF2185 domain-containing protein [Pelagicoccus mobilis]MBK1880684.1 DUF2185 domain-containing protein [Pelagicoccus mobilis]
MNPDDQMKEARRLGDKTKKPFKISGEKIERKIEGTEGCFATDRILIDGMRIGYMYKEEKDFDSDSGWRFMAGDETDEYLDDQWNSGIYTVNTICNYDEEIIQHLGAPVGSSFALDPKTGKLIELKE